MLIIFIIENDSTESKSINFIEITYKLKTLIVVLMLLFNNLDTLPKLYNVNKLFCYS